MESSGDGQIAGLFILAMATLLNRNIPNLLLFEIVLRYDIFIFGIFIFGDRKKKKNALDVDKIKKNT